MALRIGKVFGPDMNHLLRMREHSRDMNVKRYVPCLTMLRSPLAGCAFRGR